MDLQRNLTFMKKFFTQPQKNASIRPSSDRSAELLCWSLNWEKVRTVLELGPWTGPVTKHIFASMSKSATYYGLEYDKEFIAILKERFPDHAWDFIQWNIKDLAVLMREHQIPRPDVIVSTLPNSIFETYPHLVDKLAEYIQKWTIFRGITYAPELLLDVYKHIKPKVLAHTWKNVPPLYVHWVN